MVTTELHYRQACSANPSSGTRHFGDVAVAMNADGKVPDWIELLPAGPVITGRSGKSWPLTNPQALIETFKARGMALPLDFEHASEIKASKGEPAPAAAWIEELAVRDGGSIWGRIDWNMSGRAAVEAREYRYISPVFMHRKDSGEIFRLVSAALTNQPELRLMALNREEDPIVEPEDLKDIAKALGLGEDAGKDDVVKAINSQAASLTDAQKAAKAAPALDQFVPRETYDKALNRAVTAEGKLTEQETVSRDTAITAAIDAALTAGKITPATKDYYTQSCRAAGGLEAFQKFVGDAPEIAGDAPKGEAKGGKPGTLDAEQKAACRALGIGEEAFLKTLEAQKEEAA